MNYNEYLAQRKSLIAELNSIITAETIDKEAFEAKKKEVEDLDEKWATQAQMQADAQALASVSPSPAPQMLNSGSLEANGQIISTEKPETAPSENSRRDPYASMEYRQAFMEYVARGVSIPERFANAAATTTTADTGSVIPTTIVGEIIRLMKSRGNVWGAVRKLNVQGGMSFPISTLIPEAHWITESKSSDDQKIDVSTNVTFSYFGLECKIAQSLLVNVVTIAEFEALFSELAVEAIVAALEIGTFNGTGSGQMLGILNDTRIPASNVIELDAAGIAKWTTWKKSVFGKMKKAYRNGSFWMAQSTFDGYIDGMVDAQGQPIGRVNYGIDGGETYRFGGKTVETVEDDVIKSWDDAVAGDVIAVFGDLKNYAVNTNMQMTTVKWTDHDNNTIKNKVILVCDGKILDPNGFLILKKKATA